MAGTLVVRPARTARASRWVVIAAGFTGAAIPLTGVVAAIAVPGLLRARMSGNETTAIGSLRAIHSAQRTYQQACGGFAPDLPALRKFLAPDLTNAQTVSKSGYTVTLAKASEAVTLSDAPSGCEGAVTGYVAHAAPMTFGSTGTRYFATDASGRIYQDRDETFANPTPLP